MTTDRNPRDKTGRRALLTGIGAAGIGVVAGCGSSSAAGGSASPSASASSAARAPAASTSPAPSSAAPSTTASASAAPTTSAAAPATSSAAPATTAAAGFTVAKAKIPVGSGAYFSDDAVIITQPTAGQFKAFSSVCTHQGCPVTMFSGVKMICPCHGSEYSITDGSVLMGPAPAPLAAKTVTVQGADVVVAKT